jgi:hypothetical protein
MSKLLNKIRHNLALDKVATLERKRQFIDPFFCGETKYPIELAKWEKDMEKAKAKLKALEGSNK